MSVRQDRKLKKQLDEAIDFFKELHTNQTVMDSDLIQNELNLVELKLHRKLHHLNSELKRTRPAKKLSDLTKPN